MSAGHEVDGDALVSSAEVARLAGVTRAAVSNWRKRHGDFPSPIGGERNAVFALSEVRAWIERNRKSAEVPGDELLWRALHGHFGKDMIHGVADVVELITTGSSTSLNSEVQSLVNDLATGDKAVHVVDGLVERLTEPASPAVAEHVSTRRLVGAIKHFAGPVQGVVFDPACGIGSLLLGFADGRDVTLAGQEISTSAARLSEARAKLSGLADVTIHSGDSLRADRWPDLRAECVVCAPPVKAPDWGRDELLLDPRWEFGAPTRAESELAWLQHCYAHVGPGGRAIVVMPPSVAYRPAGRRIRAEIVRRGVLKQLVALPGGMAASHTQPVHLWVLVRPSAAGDPASAVRMLDLSDSDPDGPFEPIPSQTVDVPLIDLLDDTVDLTPARYVSAARADRPAEYLAIRATLIEQVRELIELLPALGSGSGSFDGAILRANELARAGLIDVTDEGVCSTSDQLDADYVNGFLRGARAARSPGGSTDSRGPRIPQMSIDDQRRYGAAFRALDDFQRCLHELARLGDGAAVLAREGLISGALRPPD